MYYAPVMKPYLKLLPWVLLVLCQPAHAAVYNLKVVTDASPDYSDMNSMIRSITS